VRADAHAPRERLAAADRNFVGGLRTLIGLQPGSEERRFGAAVAFDSRIPVRFFNGIAIMAPTDPAEADAALDWLGARGMPHEAWIREDVSEPLRAVFQQRDFVAQDWVEPVMAIEPPMPASPLPDGVTIREVTDAATLEDQVAAQVAGGLPEGPVRMFLTSAFVGRDDVRCFTAYLDGRAVGHSIAIHTGDVAGVYSVGVAEGVRSQGIGTAVTWAAVEAGRAWGSRMVVLQSSKLGFGVYRRMGFEVIGHYEIHRPTHA